MRACMNDIWIWMWIHTVTVMSCEPARTRAYHPDLRWRMVYQTKVLSYPVKKVSENLCVDQSTVRRTLKLFDTTGLVEKRMYPDGHWGTKLCKADQLHILELILENPGIYMYLHELKLELQARGTNVHESTICRFLQQANFTHKKNEIDSYSTEWGVKG